MRVLECMRTPERSEAKSASVMYAGVPTSEPHVRKVALYSPAMPEDLLANRLLAVLAPDERDRVLRGAKPEPMDAHQILYPAGREITHVYFPVSGVVSLVIKMANAADVEVMTIGNEGLVGIPAILGVTSSTMEGLCQIPGRVLKVPAKVVLEEMRRTTSLNRLLLRYSEAVMIQLAQHAACN